MIKLQEYDVGEVVLAAGELGRGFCILEDGVLEVIRDGKVLSEINMAGSIFGELSEILGLKRDAVIQAKSKAKVRHVEESIADIVLKTQSSIKANQNFGQKIIQNEPNCCQRGCF